MFTPDVIDRHGPGWRKDRVEAGVALLMVKGSHHIQHRTRVMNNDLAEAIKIADDTRATFGKSLDALVAKEREISEASKKVSGQVRDATHKLLDGLAKLEATANFDRLERMVSLLERADKAVTALAELDAAGKLERIAAVIK